jgi:hypothetical protein
MPRVSGFPATTRWREVRPGEEHIVEVAPADADGLVNFLIVAGVYWEEPEDGDFKLAALQFDHFRGMPKGTIVQMVNFEYQPPGCFFGRYRMQSVN